MSIGRRHLSSVLIDDIVEEAYERCGLSTNSGYDLKKARRGLNVLFSEWGNRGVHLWKVEKQNAELEGNGGDSMEDRLLMHIGAPEQ